MKEIKKTNLHINNNIISNEVFPNIDKDLITALKTTFPRTLPDLEDGKRIDDFGLGLLYGIQIPIDHMDGLYIQQNDEE